MLGGVFGIGTFSRSKLAIYVLIIWGLQILWSKPILDKLRYGPLEWFWRKLTYLFV